MECATQSRKRNITEEAILKKKEVESGSGNARIIKLDRNSMSVVFEFVGKTGVFSFLCTCKEIYSKYHNIIFDLYFIQLEIFVPNLEPDYNEFCQKIRYATLKSNPKILQIPLYSLEDLRITGPRYPDTATPFPHIDLPPTLKTLHIFWTHHSGITEIKFPPALEHLVLSSFYESDLNTLPSTLKSLKFENCKGDLNHLPPKLEMLKCTNFQGKIHQFPPTLRILSLPPKLDNTYDSFTYPHKLPPFPKSLQQLTLHPNYPDNNLPPSLVSLKIQTQNIGPLPFCIPDSLESLKLAGWFTEPLLSLPSSLKRLKVDNNYNFPLPVLPSSLKVLEIPDGIEYEGDPHDCELSSLPPSLEVLDLGDTFSPLPTLSLTDFTMDTEEKPSPSLHNENDNSNVLFSNFDGGGDHRRLPQTLRKLRLMGSFNAPLRNLHGFTSLRYLCLGSTWNHPVYQLPSLLVHLEIGNAFNYPLPSIPSGLEFLDLGNSFNHPLELGHTVVKSVLLGNAFNSSLTLPRTLIELLIGDPDGVPVFNQPLELSHTSLQKLRLLGDFNQPLGRLPSSLQKIELLCTQDNQNILPPEFKPVHE